MILNISKKIILLCLLFFGLGFIVPSQEAHAQRIILPGNFSGMATVGADLLITATTSPAKGDVLISFSAFNNAVSFTPSGCKTESSSGSCSVSFKSTKDGTFTIGIRANRFNALTRDITVTPATTNPKGVAGDCYVENLFITTRVNNKTSEECTALTVTTSWEPNPGTSSMLGNCTVTSQAGPDIIPNKTSIECTAYKVKTFWAQSTITTPTPAPVDTTVICKYTDPEETDPAKATNTPCINSRTAVYELLAPLPGKDAPISRINVSGKNALGKYINTIITLVIGLSGVLAVLMIIRGGIEYMTSELPGVKGEGKSRITNALLGLLIALGAWLILNTINPEILETEVDIPQATIEYDQEEEIIPSAENFASSAPATTGAINNCTEGVIPVSTLGGNFIVCSSIATNVKSMIDIANQQGFKLAGWGWRSAEKQINLRKKHCPPDILTVPSNQCRPPTARPGKSQHESGLALDLTCDRVSIQTRDNKCFLWLQNNARQFGFKNLSSEPWHWSTTGK